MRQQIIEQIEIPQGVTCEFANNSIKCKKGGVETSRAINVPTMKTSVKDNKIVFQCDSGNKNDFKIIKSQIAHMKNMFLGLEKEFVYRLESCNVHFPMTLKLEGSKVIISNFLGEKTPRFARILPGVKVDVKGAKITVTSVDKEAAGHTAANLEKATKIRNRDRRVFQDGIFITDRPGGAK
jgi:large subunit ribosomal protein L6